MKMVFSLTNFLYKRLEDSLSMKFDHVM